MADEAREWACYDWSCGFDGREMVVKGRLAWPEKKKEAGEALLKKRRDGCAEMRGITVGEGWSVGETERRKKMGVGAAADFLRKLGLGFFFWVFGCVIFFWSP